MKAVIICFSQTGNTQKVGEALAEGFRAAGGEARLIPLKRAQATDIEEAQVVGAGSPCFSSRAPQPVLDFIASLPLLSGIPGFVFATSGGGPGRVLFELTTALRQRGVRVVGGILVRGECFHPFPAIKGRFPGRPNRKDLEEARRFALSLYHHLAGGDRGPLPQSRRDALFPGRGFYDLVALINTDDQLRRLLKAPTVDEKRCTRCRWCERECPTGNIVLDPLPRISGNRCLRCYRCFSGCPEKAFTADLRVGNFLAHLFYNTFFERWLGDVRPGENFY